MKGWNQVMSVAGIVAALALAGCEGHDHDHDHDELPLAIALQFEDAAAVGANVGILKVTRRSDGSPVTGAQVSVLSELDGTPATVPAEVTELSGGEYRAAPITFDGPGKWVVHLMAHLGDDTGHEHIDVVID